MAFCPKCGKITSKFELCSDCSPKGEVLDEKEILVCARCNAIKFLNIWEKQSDIEDIVKRMIKKIYHFHSYSSLFMDEKKEGKRTWYNVRFRSKGKDYKIKVLINRQECHSCSISKSSYFEGVLQLRNATDSAIQFVHNELDKAADKGVHVTKTARVGNGVDYYITNKTFTINLGRKISKVFGGKVSANERLFTQDKMTSKEVFRVSVHVELPEAMDHDVVEISDHVVVVTSMRKELKAIDLLTGNKISLKYKDEKLSILPKVKTIVTKVYPHVEVMHPETYQSVIPKNHALSSLKKNENVKIVIDSKGSLWICEIKKLQANESE